jgi:hypothetical protein
MIPGWARLLLLLLCLSLPPVAAGARGAGIAEAACGAPTELLETGGLTLPATARAIQRGRLRLLIIGSGSVLGPGTSGPEAAWPAQLEIRLTKHFPGLRVEGTVRGGRGMLAAEAVTLLTADLRHLRPDLVLWQTGTVEAARGIDIDHVTEALNEGLDRIQQQGADAVLMDQQFSRFLRANTNIDPYRDALRLAAAAHGVPMLRRYDLMRGWAESDRIDLERTPREQRVAATDTLNACLAAAMAALIADGVAEGGGPTGARP